MASVSSAGQAAKTSQMLVLVVVTNLWDSSCKVGRAPAVCRYLLARQLILGSDRVEQVFDKHRKLEVRTAKWEGGGCLYGQREGRYLACTELCTVSSPGAGRDGTNLPRGQKTWGSGEIRDSLRRVSGIIAL
jgi:hypothetical protein